MIRHFHAAALNEWRRDIFVHEKYGFSRRFSIVIPRLEKLLSLTQRHPRLIFSASFILERLWLPLLFPVFFHIQAIRRLLHFPRRQPNLGSEIGVALTGFSPDLFKSAGFKGKFLYWRQDLREKLEEHWPGSASIYDFMRVKDLINAYGACWALRSVYAGSRLQPGFCFQTYTSFTFFLSWYIMSRLQREESITSIWFAHDSDRWAILFDRLPGRATRILLQHGLILDFSGQKFSHVLADRPPKPLPVKLRNIDRIYVFDSFQEQDYRDIVIAPRPKTDFAHYAQQISLTAWPLGYPDFLRVLIIGQPESQQTECALIEKFLGARSDVIVILRPHPLYGTRKYRSISHPRYFLSENRELYPKADLVLYFAESTLVYQYLNLGCRICRITDTAAYDDMLIMPENRVLPMEMASLDKGNEPAGSPT